MHRFASIQNVTDRQTDRPTDRRRAVAKARPIVRSAKNRYPKSSSDSAHPYLGDCVKYVSSGWVSHLDLVFRFLQWISLISLEPMGWIYFAECGIQNSTTYTLRNYRCGMFGYLLAIGSYYKWSHTLIQLRANYNFSHTANYTEFSKFFPHLTVRKLYVVEIPHSAFRIIYLPEPNDGFRGLHF